VPIRLDTTKFKDVSCEVVKELPHHEWKYNPEQIAEIVAKSIGRPLEESKASSDYKPDLPHFSVQGNITGKKVQVINANEVNGGINMG